MSIKNELFKKILFLSFLCLVTNYPIYNLIELNHYYQQTSFKEKIYYNISSINTTDVMKIFIDIIIYFGDVEANIIKISNSDKIKIGN